MVMWTNLPCGFLSSPSVEISISQPLLCWLLQLITHITLVCGPKQYERHLIQFGPKTCTLFQVHIYSSLFFLFFTLPSMIVYPEIKVPLKNYVSEISAFIVHDMMIIHHILSFFIYGDLCASVTIQFIICVYVCIYVFINFTCILINQFTL